MRVFGLAVLAIFVFAMVIAIVSSLFDDPSDCSSNSAMGYAIVFVKEEVERRIPNPHVAEFDIRTTRHIGDGLWRIAGRGDTKNVFGGPHRFRFDARVQCVAVNGERRWQNPDLDIW